MEKANIDISTYVAIGDSVTSGYSDGALYYEAQLHAYPNLLAERLREYGLTTFRQALISKDSVGIGFYGNSRMILKNDEYTNTTSLSFLAPQGDLYSLYKNLYDKHGPFHNMGIPGLKATTTLMKGYGNPANGPGNYNPFFSRVASDPESSSVLEDALAMSPTFFTLFIGNNDVLAYALSGGTMDLITPAFSNGTGTEVNFEDTIVKIIDSLVARGAKGAIANVPDIRAIPFFTSIPYNGLRIDRHRMLELNNKYAHARLHFREGNNPFVVASDEGLRFIEKGEMVLMDVLLDPEKHAYLTAELPIPKKYMLTNHEISKIQNTITGYNSILEAIASSKHLAFVNTNQLVQTIETDRIYNDRQLTLCCQKKRVFSLDGLHLNSLGQALLSNAFIQAINTTYGSFIPKINLMKYRRMTENE